MAKIKNTMTVSLEEFGKKAGEYALDEFEYKGLTIRQWADKITSGEYQPVKHGRWLPSDSYITTAYGTIHCQVCSECGADLIEDNDFDYKFCPVCGARMDSDDEVLPALRVQDGRMIANE